MNRYAIVAVDVNLVPMSSGNRLRIDGFLRALRRLDWRIGLVTVRTAAPLAHLRDIVDEVTFVPVPAFEGGALSSYAADAFATAVTALAQKRQPAVAIAQYAWLAPALAGLDPAVQRWIDCHDLLHERTERFAGAGLDSWVQCTWEEERARLMYGDLMICCQARDRDRLATLLPEKRVVSIMTPVDVPASYVPQPGSGTTVLTLGALHDGNLAVPAFAASAWDRVVAAVPQARLRVAGGIGATVVARPSVEVLGIVDRLDAEYADATVVVCPVTAGSGVKTKMLEALRYGKAVVTTELGAEGMPHGVTPAWVTTSSLDSCADEVTRLLMDGPARAALERAAFAFALETVSGTAFQEQIGRLLPGDLPPLDALEPAAPAVSVIVTQVLSWRELRACLHALGEQHYPPFQVEIIVVVETYVAALWSAMQNEFAHVVMVCSASDDAREQRRVGAARAHGAFLAFIDADCRADPEWLERATATCAEHGGGVMVVEDVRTIGPPRRNGYSWYDALIAHPRQPGDVFLIARERWCDDVPAVRATESRIARHVARGRRLLAARLRRGTAPPARSVRDELAIALTDRRVPHRARLATALAVLRIAHVRPVSTRHDAPRASAGRRVPSACTLVSVVIPSLGWPDALNTCLRAVADQALDLPCEIIVVVNGPDAVVPALTEWPDVRVVYEPLAGPAAARNTGVRVARGDVIAFIDADCVAAPQWLAESLKTLRAAGLQTIVAGAIARPPARGNGIAAYDRATYLRQRDYVAMGACVTANLVMHRETFDFVGAFDTAFSEAAAEDWDWATRANALSVPIVFAPAAVVVHPCMTTAAELKRKAERLARGNALLARKRGTASAGSSLSRSLGDVLVRAVRTPGADGLQRLSLLWNAARVAVWGERAARQLRRRDRG